MIRRARGAAVAIAVVAMVGVGAPMARANVSTLGGLVMHEQRTHVIFWNPAGAGLQFDPGYQPLIETFLRQVAAASGSAGNEFGLMGQYGGPGGPAAYSATFAGSVDAADPVPAGAETHCQEPPPPPAGDGPGWTVCVSDAGLQTEVEHVIRGDGLPTGFKDIYFVVMPRGFASCFADGPSDCALGGDSNSGYCGYHADIGSARILYAVIPYNALPGHCRSEKPRPNQNAADPTISTIAHELAETATDPLGDAWSDHSGGEIGDICLKHFGPPLNGSSGATAYNEVIDGGHYYLQELWSNAAHDCAAMAPPDRASIAIGGPRAAGQLLALSARATAAGRRFVSFAWTFGDGHSHRSRGSVTHHTWTRPGLYTTALTVTDSWGDRATARRTIRISRS